MSAYVFPFAKTLTKGRIDQGIDYGGAGKVFAIGNAIVERVAPQGSNTGWPGAAGSGTGAMIVYRLVDGPRAGQHIYLAENIDPVSGLKVGDKVLAGQHIATARGAYPYLETGWAADAQGSTLSGAHGTRDTHPNHSNTPEGAEFASFISRLTIGGGSQDTPAVGGKSNAQVKDALQQQLDDVTGNATGVAGDAASTLAKGVVTFLWDAIGTDALRILLYAVFVGGGLALTYVGVNRTLNGQPGQLAARMRAGATKEASA